jgi:hypothetical protein
MAHELDAMTQAEWRLLFILSSLPEVIAEVVFVLLHIPLVAGLLWLTNSEELGVKRLVKDGRCRLSRHPRRATQTAGSPPALQL